MSHYRGPGPCRDCGQHSPNRHPAGRCDACHERRAADRSRIYNLGPTALYRLYDEHGVLLYVGIGADVEQRWKDHHKEMPWFSEVARREIAWLPYGRNDAHRAERAVIRAERPLYNRQDNYDRLPDGCPPPPQYANRTGLQATYFPEWFAWRAIFRDYQLNPEERKALGR